MNAVNKVFEDEAWEDYLNWSDTDEEILKKINSLISEIDEGTANPKRLKHRNGWFLPIDDQNQLAFKIDKKNLLHIISCKGHHE